MKNAKISAKLLNTTEIEKLFRELALAIPSPRSELNFSNEFTFAVAVILSAQSNDKAVNKVTPRLFATADTPHKMLELGEVRLRDMIKTLGLYNNKAKNIIALSSALLEKHGGLLPQDYSKLCELPGIGSKSAKVLLNNLHNAPEIAVDTHVFRIANRLGLCATKTITATERALTKVVPEHWQVTAHNLMVLHGRYVCVARKPRCAECRVRDICRFNADATAGSLDNKYAV